MVVLITIGFITVTAFQIVHFFKKKQYKEASVYLALMAFALIYAISGLTEWDFPAPDKLTEMIFKPFSNYVFNAQLRK